MILTTPHECPSSTLKAKISPTKLILFLLKPVPVLGKRTYGKENAVFKPNKPRFKSIPGNFNNIFKPSVF